MLVAQPVLAMDKTSRERAAIIKEVKEGLKDPYSAQFKWSEVFMLKGSTVHCGWVNAKNGYGGYKGYTPFIALVATNGKQFIVRWDYTREGGEVAWDDELASEAADLGARCRN